MFAPVYMARARALMELATAWAQRDGHFRGGTQAFEHTVKGYVGQLEDFPDGTLAVLCARDLYANSRVVHVSPELSKELFRPTCPQART